MLACTADEYFGMRTIVRALRFADCAVCPVVTTGGRAPLESIALRAVFVCCGREKSVRYFTSTGLHSSPTDVIRCLLLAQGVDVHIFLRMGSNGNSCEPN